MLASSPIRVCKLIDLRGAEPLAVSANGVDVVLARTQAGLRAFEGRCPHQGALLGEGEIVGDALVCRNHRWRFSVDTGERQGGPQCLASYPVVERDGDVFIDVSSSSLRRGPNTATRTLEDLPGPKGLPVLGNIHQIEPTKLHLILERWGAQYGPVFLYRKGSAPVVVISDVKMREQVLRARPETFSRFAAVGPVFSEMGLDGVFSAEGDAWRTRRKLTTSALAQRNVRGLYPKLRTVVDRLKRRWEGLADTGATVDILDELKRFTVDIATLITFGYDVNTIEGGDDVIQRKLELVFPMISRRLLSLLPTWRLIRLSRDRRVDRAVSELRAWMGELVAAERARLATAPDVDEKPSNILQAMLSARDEEGRPFSDDVIFGNLMTMLAAGEDTTANTLGWAVHHLCDSPEWTTKLRREADELMGESDVAADIETANNLSVAGAVADETMRLRPVAPAIIVQAKVETVVGDLLVPAGTSIALLTRPAATQSDSFGEPKAFRPERWLGETVGAHDVSAHIPFGSGPRICPGRVHALLEIKLLLSMLYKNFDVERIGPAEEVRENFAFTMSPVGAKVRLRRRSRAAQTVRGRQEPAPV
jgi:cytochrome P450/nitrite reductase/ring-hydroxylating ferredoxin subunit